MAIQQRNSEMVELLSADFVLKRLPHTYYGDFSGYMHREVVLPDTDAVTLVPNDDDAYSVKTVARVEALTVVDSGGYLFVGDEAAPGGTVTLYTDADVTVTIAVAALGGITVYLTGTPSASIHIKLTWI